MPPFLDLNINIEDVIFVYRLFDERVKFLFFVVCMPNFPNILFHNQRFMVKYFQDN